MGNGMSLCAATHYRVFVLGHSSAGKSSIVQRLKSPAEAPALTLATVENEEFPVQFGRNTIYVTDTAVDNWQQKTETCHGVIYVVDASVTDEEQIKINHRFFTQQLSDKSLRSLPILVLGNKGDVPTILTKAQLSEKFGIDRLKGQESRLEMVSAKTGVGLEEAIKWLVKAMEAQKK